jgi:acyl-CoA synthetase (AMP-forming)/AMP-acid ligase II
MSIGKPIRNMKFFIKKINGKKNEGELIISGPQVAECYFNNKELNEEKFMKKNRKKFYLTGDVVFKKNGHYFFKFRNDFQIKIRGYRVELPEIDNLIKKKMISLNSFSLFLKGKIITFLYKPKFNKIRIYFFLRKYLPNYMIPNDLVFLKKIPTNVNGKIDLKKISKNYAKR